MIMRHYIRILVLIILCFITNTFLSNADDTLSPNQTLSGDETIVSSDGEFELGFFSPGKSSKHYIGIWYKKITVKTVIWVANRETPISDKSSAHLEISQGNLVLVNESQRIWSTGLKTTDTSSSVSAVLLDDGNLVLRQGLGSNSSSTAQNLWESFGNPSDTLMPGARIGYNKITKKKQLLTSWKNSEDPAPGLFTLEPDHNIYQYVIKRNGSEYWGSGAFDGEIFSEVPEKSSARNFGYEFTYFNNENESYYMYKMRDPLFISRQIMDVSGQIKQLMWTGTSWNVYWFAPKQCEVRDYCGEFGVCSDASSPFCSCLEGFKHRFEDEWALNDFSGGCVREEGLECGNGGRRKDEFMMIPDMVLPQYSRLLSVESRGECESACSSDCSCMAYAYDEGGCSLWKGGMLNLQRASEGNSSGKSRTIYVRLSAYSSVLRKGEKDKGVVVGVAVGCSVMVVVVVLAVLAALWRRRRSIGTNEVVEGSLVAFKYKDLQNATTNFSDKLGGGGFGSVYRGMLPDSSVVAVKKLESANQGEKQFRAEVSTTGTIQHVNLVRLLGFCREGKEQLLVYEYLQNGSLDSHLFRAKESKVLGWKTRYQIALGIARGLVYLHEKCRECIIHCDIKPENILLDADFWPKVGDFGLAKLVGRDFSRVLTTMRGTRGYLAPEWLSGVAITAKADVYSYGMLLFELVSGRRNRELLADDNANFFPLLAASVTVNGGDVPGLLDPSLNRDADEEEVSTICKVACWCVQDDENTRPSMSRVVQILEGVVSMSSPPIPQGLRALVAARQEHIVFFTDSSTSSGPSSSPSKTNSSATN